MGQVRPPCAVSKHQPAGPYRPARAFHATMRSRLGRTVKRSQTHTVGSISNDRSIPGHSWPRRSEEIFLGIISCDYKKYSYEALPYLYLVAAVAAFDRFRHFPGSFLGPLLVLISGIVFLARSNRREEPSKKKS